MTLAIRRRTLTRLLLFFCFAIGLRYVFFTPSASISQRYTSSYSAEIEQHNLLERVITRQEKQLNVQKHRFLQSRQGRDERPDIMDDFIHNGVADYWERFQLPYVTSLETSHMDAQNVLKAIEQLLSLNGWVGALCPTLVRPFGQNKNEETYDDLASDNHLYYIAIVIHSADHFLVDQLAVIVQLAKRLGSANLFVSMLDYASTDSTETLTDLCEAVLTLLSVPFRIRRVPPMTEDPLAAYYPFEEAHTRNLVLEPLHEFYERRNIKFHRVIWLKGFTCPNDILETIKVSVRNEAAMVCGMDWAEHNGFFIFSDRWRTRDIEGDQFRQSKSSSKPDAVPPRDKVGAARYNQHLPFQVFCCESGTHIVDPAQSYYAGITYRAGTDFFNASATATDNSADSIPMRASDAQCLDSAQAWFCRDLWVHSASEGAKDVEEEAIEPQRRKRDINIIQTRQVIEDEDQPIAELAEPLDQGINAPIDATEAEANAGSDFDAMPDLESDNTLSLPSAYPSNNQRLAIPNSVFRPARILVNPRCVTTYAGVRHTQLAMDLFGADDEEDVGRAAGKYVLEDWEGAPESFVCQEQRQTGGRKATKSQRRLGFSIHDELERQ